MLEGRGLVKTFGTVNALQGADFIVDAGTVTALIGDNGAGKSTLVKVLSGVHPPDGGEILLDGEPVTFHSPLDAHRMGIETVYQDLALAPHLDAAANVFLGREIRRGRRVHQQAGDAQADDDRVQRPRGDDCPGSVGPGGVAVGGQRQSVAIARSALWAKRVIFFDEPTAALGVVQTRRVLDLIRRVRDQGLGVVLITHTLPDALEVADRVEVLRHGRRSAHFDRRRDDRTARGGDHRSVHQRRTRGGAGMNKPTDRHVARSATAPSPDRVDDGAHRRGARRRHPHRNARLRRRIRSIGWLYTLVVFAVEVPFFSITAGDRFLTTNNLILTAQNVAVLTVVACGATFVLITAGVDLSVGSVAILGEVVAAKTIIAAGASGRRRRRASASSPGIAVGCSSA